MIWRNGYEDPGTKRHGYRGGNFLTRLYFRDLPKRAGAPELTFSRIDTPTRTEWMAEYVGGELALNAAEVSDARWLTVDEICRLDGTFEGDREFYRTLLPSLTF